MADDESKDQQDLQTEENNTVDPVSTSDTQEIEVENTTVENSDQPIDGNEVADNPVQAEETENKSDEVENTPEQEPQGDTNETDLKTQEDQTSGDNQEEPAEKENSSVGDGGGEQEPTTPDDREQADTVEEKPDGEDTLQVAQDDDTIEAVGETEGQADASDAAGDTDGGDKPTEPEGQEMTEVEAEVDAEENNEAEEKLLSPVPQSDTFADGERPESPVAIGEKLSREGTPEELNVEDDRSESPPVPETPELGSEEEPEEEEEEEEEDKADQTQFDREVLIERYHQSLTERQQLQEQNYQLQHKLADYFRKKKSDETQRDADKNVADQEQRYLKYMANLENLRRQDTEEREIFKVQIEDLKDRCQDKQSRVDDERQKFMEIQRQVALGAVNSRSGKSILPKDTEQYLGTMNRKEAEVVNVRLENIKLKNKLKKKENQLKSKEELAEGLHLIDFEQLKIENQTYNEKIEERNEELMKLRKKITSTVEVLTHLKEKLQFVQAENQVQRGTLREVEEKAARKRDILSRTKQARDALRIDNQKLRQNCGLLGNEPLLRDFEERKDEGEELHDKLERLKMEHAELTLNLNGVRRKIDQANGGQQ